MNNSSDNSDCDLPLIAEQLTAGCAISCSFLALTKHINLLKKLGFRQREQPLSSGMKKDEEESEDEVDGQEVMLDCILVKPENLVMPKEPATPPQKRKRAPPKPKNQKVLHKKAKATATSTMRAPSPTQAADVVWPEDSDSSDGLDESLFSSATLAPKNTGQIGSRIICRKEGSSYMWESKTGTSAAKFIDIKIYDDPRIPKKKSPLEMWKYANFSAKAYVGNPLLPKSGQRVLKAIKEVQNAIVEDFKARHPQLANPVQMSDGNAK